MAISNHRKFLPFPTVANQTTATYCYITTKGTFACSFSYSPNSPPSPPFLFPPVPDLPLRLPPPVFSDQEPQPPQQTTAHHISPVVIIIASILGSLLFLLTYFFIILKFCSCNFNRRSTTTTTAAQTQQNNSTLDDFLDENLGLVIDNPIWYINTVGLDQSVINSIAMFKYKKGDGLVEETDCSVCLSEFREDEPLRLLPKCSHAFHLPCIDTWLRSHKNCPLCRAAIVSNLGRSGSAGIVLGSDDSGRREEAVETTRVEGFESSNGRRLEGEEESRGDDDEIGDDPIGVSSNPISKSGIRVFSDLVDNHRGGIQLQPVRRSVSMDFSIFCFSMGNLVPVEESSGGSSGGAQLDIRSKSNLAIVPKNSGVNPFLLRLHKSPLSMKRSLSSGGDGKKSSSSSRHSRNRSSLLPL